MPSSFIGEILFEMIVYLLVYGVGTVVVPIISFGRWKCDHLLRDAPKKKKKKIKWGGFYHLRGQQVYLTADATALIGLVTVFLAIAVGRSFDLVF